jgi:hypothetical protein
MIVKLKVARRNKKNGDGYLWYLVDDTNVRHVYVFSTAVFETQEAVGLQIIILSLNLLVAWRKNRYSKETP